MEGIIHREHFVSEPENLYHTLHRLISWDESMATRKTVSFGKAYNYSQMVYPEKTFLPELEDLSNELKKVTGYTPNNCLVNYYPDGKSKMGYHSDRTDNLEKGTGVAIVSLGTTRTLRFRNINNPGTVMDYELSPGSLIYMTQEIQKEWQHAIPKGDTNESRISLTFRKIK